MASIFFIRPSLRLPTRLFSGANRGFAHHQSRRIDTPGRRMKQATCQVHGLANPLVAIGILYLQGNNDARQWAKMPNR
jgi:hypothetical protein